MVPKSSSWLGKIIYLSMTENNIPDYRRMKDVMRISLCNIPAPIDLNENGQKDYEHLAAVLKEYNCQTHRLTQPVRRETHTNIDSLQTHLLIMDAYFDVLYSYDEFRALLDGKPIAFMHVLTQLHDSLRFMVNGQYPLQYTEGISHSFGRRILKSLIGEEAVKEFEPYSHTMDWITDKSITPDFITASNPQKIARIIKSIDTISKLDEGELADPKTYFDRGYQIWMEYQRQTGRFPVSIFERRQGETKGSTRIVSLEDYVRRDRQITEEGLAFVEQITVTPFDTIRQKAMEKLKV